MEKVYTSEFYNIWEGRRVKAFFEMYPVRIPDLKPSLFQMIYKNYFQHSFYFYKTVI